MTQRDRNLLLILGLGAVASIAAAIIIWAGQADISELTAPPVNATRTFVPTKAPDFELALFSGKTIKLSDFRGKKPVVLNFWASWCPPCREEAPALSKIAKDLGDRVEFIGVAVNDSRENAEKFMEEFDITYENGLDISDIGPAYKITGIPETFWIDKNGQIIDRWIGAIDEAGLISRTQRLIDG